MLCIPHGTCHSSIYRSKTNQLKNRFEFGHTLIIEDLWFQLLATGSHESPEWFATILNDELIFIEVIRLLCDHALIEPVNEFSGYSMHTCVHAWAAHVLNADWEISTARLALNCVGAAVPTHDVSEHWAIGRRLLPHAR